MQRHKTRITVTKKWRLALTGGMLGVAFAFLGGCSSDDMAPQRLPDAKADTQADIAAPKDDKLRNDIVAVVNDTPISAYDLRQRTSLIMVTSGIPDTPEMYKKVREQAFEQLQTEALQRLEAQKKDVTVSSVEVNKRIQEIMEDSHISKAQLEQILARGHVTMAALRAQIASQLLWQRAVQMEYAGRINISPEAVDAEMKRLSESAGKVHYVVSEIFVAVDNPDQDAKAHKDAENIYDQIKAGAPFSAVARQFSQSASAAQGGGIGVVYDGQLAPELNRALAKMKTGEISQPIRAVGGYYILALHQRLEPYGTKIDTTKPEDRPTPESLPLARLLLPLGPHPSPKLAENALRVANTLAQHLESCSVMPRLAKQIQGAVFMDLGKVRLADLSASIREKMVKTAPGSPVQPFLSDAGVEVFMRCDKAIPKLQAFQMPTREQVENQMFEEQISAMARRYNRDLKRNADIEIR
jgi:peptidyl-prolyl cis-trans isomerase SurA